MNQPKVGNTNKQEDGVTTSLMFCGLIFMIFFMIWSQCHTEISTVVVFIQNIITYPFWKLGLFISNFFNGDKQLINDLLTNRSVLCVSQDSIAGFRRLPYANNIFGCTRDPSTIEFVELSLNSIVFNLIFIIPSAIMIIKGYLRIESDHARTRFRQLNPPSLDEFKTEQSVNYTHLLLYKDFNPTEVSNIEGQLMGMLTTREFCKKNNLIVGFRSREIKTFSKGTTRTQQNKKEKIPVIDREKLQPILKEQLGKLWSGLDGLSPLEIVIFARHLPRAYSIYKHSNVDANEFKEIERKGYELEDALWQATTEEIIHHPKFQPYEHKDRYGKVIYPFKDRDLECVNIEKLKEDFIEPYLNTPFFEQLKKDHAYTNTMLIKLIVESRKSGVLAPCQLRWIKFYNRSLWALLQNVGRPSFYCENMGSISHYCAEIALGKSMYEPHFEVAISGFERQLQVYHYDDEDLLNLGMPKSILFN